MNPATAPHTEADRAAVLYSQHHDEICRRADRMFAWLLGIEWVAGIAAALWLTPFAWAGADSSIHPHLWAAVVLGALIVSLPMALAVLRPGKASTRHVIAGGQMLYSALLIHVMGGRIETHFHVFGSLAFVAFYRDWRVLLTATAVIAIDHLLRGLYWPKSVFGTLVTSNWRWLEHAGWVVFEDIFLLISIRQCICEMHSIANRHAELECTNASIEARVLERTEELNRSQGEMLRLKDYAEEANRAKSEFLANMSHELRTPLNGVIGMAELLINSKLPGRQNDYALTVRRSAETLLTILNDILDLSKIEAGKLTFEDLPFDLHNLVEEVAVLMSARAAEKKLELIVRYSPVAPRTVIGDPVRIRQVLSNIVGNAVKFTATGHVLMEVCCTAHTDGKAVLCLRVEDTGIGIETGQEQRLFQKFTQADSSTTRRFGGTGLGLAICKNIVELMGGTISVHSTLGKGSIFTVMLALPESEELEPNGQITTSVDLQALRFLIVDDNEVNRKVLCEQLESWNLRHAAVSSGAEALLALQKAVSAQDPFHLAILDYQMPEMDGETLAQTIKGDQSISKTSLIMLTSMGHQFSAERMRTAGIEVMLHKPTRQSALLDTLNNVTAARISGKPARPRSTRGGRAPVSSMENLYVLLVEDNEVNREVALGMLETLGCKMEVAINGQEAVELYKSRRFDLVLMDCQMPVMDGFEATGEIRRLEHEAGGTNHIPIVAMTANAMKGDRERCIESGMDEYLAKPVRLEALTNILKSMSPAAPKLVQPVIKLAIETPPAAASASTCVNFERALETASNKPDRLKRIFRAFLSDAPKRVAALKTALAAGDRPVAEREAHSIKGAASNIAADGLRSIAFEIENACRFGDIKRATELTPVLESNLSDVVNKLSETLENETSSAVVSAGN